MGKRRRRLIGGTVYDIVKLVHNTAWVVVVSALGITFKGVLVIYLDRCP
jgi:hypothetical protein